MADPPTGTVTFLFTDIEGSTRLWEEQLQSMQASLVRHDTLLRHVIRNHHGHVFKTVGDQFCAVFTAPGAAVAAAIAAQRALRDELQPLRVRMAVHTGAAEFRDADYFGPALNRVARLLSAGHGGQVLPSAATAEQLPPEVLTEIDLRSLGVHRLRDLTAREAIFQLQAPGLRAHFPPLNTLDVAFRRGAVRAAAVGSVVVLAMGLLTGVAVRQSQRASALAQNLRRSLYVSDMNVACQSWQAGNAGRARDLLEAHRPRSGEEDLRGFEWRYLWGLCRDESLYTFDVGAVTGGAALSLNGCTLAAGGRDGSVHLWDVTSPERPRAITTLHGNPKGVANGSIAFSRDGRMLAVGNNGGTLTLWDTTSHVVIASFSGAMNDWGNVAFAFAPDSKALALASENHTVRIWDIASRQVKSTIRGYRSVIMAAAFSPDGKLLATDGDGTVRLLEAPSWRERAPLRHASYLQGLAFSPDSRMLAAGGGYSDAWIWDVASGKKIASLPGHHLGIASLTFSPDGRMLATGGMDQLVKLWEQERSDARGSWRQRATLFGHTHDVRSVSFSRDSSLLATGGDSTAKLWLTSPRRETQLPTGSAVAFSPDGMTLAAIHGETRVTLWDVARREAVSELKAPEKPGGGGVEDSVAFSPDGRMLASCRADRVRLWDIPSRRQVHVFPGPREEAAGVARVAFSPDGAILATGGTARGQRAEQAASVSRPEVVLWSVATKQRITSFGDATTPVVFSPDGKTLATADPDQQEVILWDVATRRRIYTTRGHRDLGDTLAAIAISPDGKTLAIGSYSTVLILLDMATKRETVIKGHLSSLSCLAFSPDGRTLATGGGDHAVKLWNIATHPEAATLEGHREYLGSVTFSPDGNLLVSADGANQVRLWRAATMAEADAPVRARRTKQ